MVVEHLSGPSCNLTAEAISMCVLHPAPVQITWTLCDVSARAHGWKPGDVCLWHNLGATSSSEPRALPLKVNTNEALHFQEPTPHASSYLYGTLHMQLPICPIIRDKIAFCIMIDITMQISVVATSCGHFSSQPLSRHKSPNVICAAISHSQK